MKNQTQQKYSYELFIFIEFSDLIIMHLDYGKMASIAILGSTIQPGRN